MHKGRKASKRIFASLLAATLVMSTLEDSAFSVSAAQLETEVSEDQTAETTETEAVTGTETETASEENVVTEVSTEMEETTTEEAGEPETGTEEAVETEMETETSAETEAVVETEIIAETEETAENVGVIMDEQTASEEDYGEPLASGTCGASYEENGEEKTYDVKWAVYDSNADEDDTVNTGDVLVISGSGMMEDFSKDSTPPYSSYKASLKQVEVKSGVTSIGKYAFYQCSSLVSIELPDGLTRIGSSAFQSCSSLESIELPDSVTSIGGSAFASCSSLASIELSDCVMGIGDSAFSDCSSLTSIKIPKNVTSIGSNAFGGTASELKIYAQASDWYETYKATDWGNTTAELVKPYHISYQLGEKETLVAEVYADGNQCYTFKDGDLPEEGMWQKATENAGTGDIIYNGMTIKNINQDILLVQADMDGFYITAVPEQTYTGKALKPEPAVYDCSTGKRLEKGKDYTITYKNNVKAYTLTVEDRAFDFAKAPEMVIKGKGDYDKTLTINFTIQPKDIGDKDVITNDMLVEYTGAVQKKVPVVTYNNKKLSGAAKPATGQTLKNSKDFVYSYPALDAYKTKKKAYKEIGTYEILVEGTGNFTGSRTVNLTVINKGTDFTKATVKKIPAQTYTGKAITLTESQLVVTAKVNGKKVTLQQDTDYSVSYKNNKNVGTATVTITGIGDYTGTKTATFQIKGTSLAKAQVSGLENKVYNGEAQTQELTLKLSGKTVSGNETVKTETVLKEGKDYTVSYDKNVNVGTAKVTITGKGGYTGTIKKTFKITAYSFDGETDAEGNLKEGSSLTETNGLLSMKDGELSVKYVKGGCQPAVQLVFKGKTLTAGKDYTLSYSKNKAVSTLKPGDEGYKEKNAPTITIKGKGNFTGSIKKTFQITGKNLDDSESPVTITVADKAATNKKGGYISKPVLTDKDGKVLKEGTDYEKPEYTIVVADGDSKEETPLDPKDTVAAGAEVTVKVKGKGAYTGELTETYRITEKDFGKVKVQSIQKDYTGKEVTLSEADFAIADGTGKGTSKVTFGSGKDKVELEYGKDFKIVEGSYKNNIKKGTASVTLEGLGEYGGTKTIKFKIGVRGFFWWLFK